MFMLVIIPIYDRIKEIKFFKGIMNIKKKGTIVHFTIFTKSPILIFVVG